MDFFRPGRPPEFTEVSGSPSTPVEFDPWDDLGYDGATASAGWTGTDLPDIEPGLEHPEPFDDPLERPDITAPPGRGRTELPEHEPLPEHPAPFEDAPEASTLKGPEPPHTELLEPVGRSAGDWAEIARSVFDRVMGVPGDWQHRDIAGPLTGEELYEQLRSLESTDRVDAYRFATEDGRDFTVVLPSLHRPTDRIFQRVGIRLLTEATKASVDAIIGVPVLTLLSAPTDLAGSFFYAASLAELEELLKHPRPS